MRLAYVISSSVYLYSTLALPRLLESMKDIDPLSIFAIIIGARREREDTTKFGTFCYLTTETRELSALAHAAEILDGFTHLFYLHDTCMCGPRFLELSRNFDASLEAVGSAPHGGVGAQCNIGAYSLEFLQGQRAWLEKFKTASAREVFDNEGVLYDRSTRRRFYGGQPEHTDGPRDIYGTGTPRITLYFRSLDLWKYQSNYGQHRHPLAMGNAL